MSTIHSPLELDNESIRGQLSRQNKANSNYTYVLLRTYYILLCTRYMLHTSVYSRPINAVEELKAFTLPLTWMDASVRDIMSFGVFVELSAASVWGLVPTSEPWRQEP